MADAGTATSNTVLTLAEDIASLSEVYTFSISNSSASLFAFSNAGSNIPKTCQSAFLYAGKCPSFTIPPAPITMIEKGFKGILI
ncbi:hypothetical protein D3C87_1420010 [compost metagenome]